VQQNQARTVVIQGDFRWSMQLCHAGCCHIIVHVMQAVAVYPVPAFTILQSASGGHCYSHCAVTAAVMTLRLLAENLTAPVLVRCRPSSDERRSRAAGAQDEPLKAGRPVAPGLPQVCIRALRPQLPEQTQEAPHHESQACRRRVTAALPRVLEVAGK
jgi:hypothetical protein